MENSYIYALIHPKTKKIRYIGKTVKPHRRLVAHRYANNFNKLNNSLFQWLRQLEKKNLKTDMIILCKCKRINENKLEKQYITKYRNKGFKLLNERSGGDGWNLRTKRRWTIKCENARLRQMRKVIIRNIKSGKETLINSIKDCGLFLNVSPRTVCYYLGKKRSFISCKGFYIRYAEEPFTPPTKLINIHNYIRICQKTKKEKIFKNKKELERFGYDYSAVLAVCVNYQNRKTYRGYKWERRLKL